MHRRAYADVEALRVEHEDAPENRLESFHVSVRAWADAIQGIASTDAIKQWCKDRRVPMSARFEIDLYTAAKAAVFARSWCHKMQFFYNVASDARPFTPAELDSYREPSEFALLATELATHRQAAKRVTQIRLLFRR